MDMSKICGNRHFSGIKAPQGATRRKGAFQNLRGSFKNLQDTVVFSKYLGVLSKTYLNKINSCLLTKSSMFFFEIQVLVTFCPVTVEHMMNIKMVRMVQRNLFYNMDLKE